MGKRTPARGQICSLTGCDRPVLATMLCTLHYNRKSRTGSVGPVEPLYDPDRGCSVASCDRPHDARGWCRFHYTRWRATGDPETDRLPGVNINRRKPKPPCDWRTIHAHLARVHGKARQHSCRFCGISAADWCYDYRDPDVRYTSGTQMPFSLNPVHYIPLCKSCHKQMDNRERAREVISETAILRNQQQTIDRLVARVTALEAIINERTAA